MGKFSKSFKQFFSNFPRVGSIALVWGVGLLIIAISWGVAYFTGSEKAGEILAVALTGLFIVSMIILAFVNPNKRPDERTSDKRNG